MRESCETDRNSEAQKFHGPQLLFSHRSRLQFDHRLFVCVRRSRRSGQNGAIDQLPSSLLLTFAACRHVDLPGAPTLNDRDTYKSDMLEGITLYERVYPRRTEESHTVVAG